MENFEFETTENINEEYVNKYVEEAKREVCQLNGGSAVDLELEESTVNQNFTKGLESYSGVYEKNRVVKNGTLIGYLEIFKSNGNDFLTIYTSPKN